MKKSVILIVIAVLTVLFIFFNSTLSGAVSNGMTYDLMDLLKPLLDKIDSLIGEQNWYALLRKLAHFTEFFVLGAVSIGVVKCFTEKRRYVFLTVAGVVGVAAFDEIIQIFSHRTSLFADTVIDIAGAVSGILIVLLVRKLHSSRKEATSS